VPFALSAEAFPAEMFAAKSFATFKSTPTAIVTASAVVTAPAIVAVEPGPRANKHASGKIIGAVISVWRAIVGRVSVISVRTDRRRTNVVRLDIFLGGINRPNPDAHAHLRIRRSGRYRNNSQQHRVL
jgi:hypothetical protein